MVQMETSWSDRKFKSILEKICSSGNEMAIIEPFMKPSVWAEKFIRFDNYINPPFPKLDLSLTPYLRDPLDAWDFSNVIREVTFCAPEQLGKTLVECGGLLWAGIYKPGIALTIYPSDEKCELINKNKLEPLMKSISPYKEELNLPRSKKINLYNFSFMKIHFMGAGARVTSQSSNIRILDELDDFTEHENQVATIADVRKRARAFSESILYAACTPTNESGIWAEYLNSSMGAWYLRCQGCRQLTLRSSEIINLQWQCDDKNNPIENTIRLICPSCGREHVESEARQMNIEGAYIHENPGLTHKHPGFQVGALASQFPTLCWLEIAKAQMLAGKSHDIKNKRYLYNSIRGLPFKETAAIDDQFRQLKEHVLFDDIPVNDLCGLLLGVDTQDECTYHVICALDKRNSLYVLECGKVLQFSELKALMEAYRYEGLHIVGALQDEGGHRPQEVNKLAGTIPNWFVYKGNNRLQSRIAKSETSGKRLNVKEIEFKKELLYYLYTQKNRENNYIFFVPNLPDEFYRQLSDCFPNNKLVNGHDYENWIDGKNNHYFDALKQVLALREFLQTSYGSSIWKQPGNWGTNKRSVVIKKSTNQYNGWATKFQMRSF